MAGLSLDALGKVSEILRHRWDLAILDLLSEKPQRFSEIEQQVSDPSGRRISDGVLSLALARLVDEGLVAKTPGPGRRSVYNLTPLGNDRVDRLQQISDIASSPEV